MQAQRHTIHRKARDAQDKLTNETDVRVYGCIRNMYVQSAVALESALDIFTACANNNPLEMMTKKAGRRKRLRCPLRSVYVYVRDSRAAVVADQNLQNR